MVTTNEKSIVGYTQKRKRNPNITLKIAIKSQRKKEKEMGKNDLQSSWQTSNKIRTQQL